MMFARNEKKDALMHLGVYAVCMTPLLIQMYDIFSTCTKVVCKNKKNMQRTYYLNYAGIVSLGLIIHHFRSDNVNTLISANIVYAKTCTCLSISQLYSNDFLQRIKNTAFTYVFILPVLYASNLSSNKKCCSAFT